MNAPVDEGLTELQLAKMVANVDRLVMYKCIEDDFRALVVEVKRLRRNLADVTAQFHAVAKDAENANKARDDLQKRVDYLYAELDIQRKTALKARG